MVCRARKYYFFVAWFVLGLTSIEPALALAQQTQSANQADQLIAQVFQLSDQRELEAEVFAMAVQSPYEPVRKAAIIGLGRIGSEQAVSMLANLAWDEVPGLRQQQMMAMGITGDKKLVPLIIEQFQQEKSLAVQQEALLALGNLGGNQAFAFLLKQLEKATYSGYAAHAIGLLATWHPKDTYVFNRLDYEQLLLQTMLPDSVALQTAFMLTRIPIKDQVYSEARLVEAIERAPDSQVKGLLLKNWGRIPVKAEATKLFKWLDSPAKAVRYEALRALKSAIKQQAVYDQVRRMLSNADPMMVQLATEAIFVLDDQTKVAEFALRESDEYIQQLAMNYLAKHKPQAAYEFIKRLPVRPTRYLKVQAAQTLKQLGTEKAMALLTQWKDDKDSYVVRAAKVALGEIDPDSVIDPPRNTPSFAQAYQSLQYSVKIVTNKGEFIIELFPTALFTANNFIELVQKRYYHGALLHRVVPNFVAQGGDHQGDGMGTPSYTIREELSTQHHNPGTVGMATLGKDTGGAQFFVNLAPNLHLDRRYTVFGKVTSGMNIVHKLSIGDWIQSAEIVKR